MKTSKIIIPVILITISVSLAGVVIYHFYIWNQELVRETEIGEGHYNAPFREEAKKELERYKQLINKALDERDDTKLKELLRQADQFVKNERNLDLVKDFSDFEWYTRNILQKRPISDDEFKRILNLLENQNFTEWVEIEMKLRWQSLPSWVHERLAKIFHSSASEEVKVKIMQIYQRSPWGSNKNFLFEVLQKDKSARVRKEAARIFFSGDVGALPFNVDLSENEVKSLWTIYQNETDSEVKVRLLATFSSVYSSIPFVKDIIKNEAFRSTDPTIRAAALSALPKDKPENVDLIMQYLVSDTNSKVRSSSYDHLFSVYKEIRNDKLESVKHMQSKVESTLMHTMRFDPDYMIRVNAVKSILFLSDPPANIIALIEFIKNNDQDSLVRSSAESALTYMKLNKELQEGITKELKKIIEKELQEHEIKFGKDDKYYELEKRLKQLLERHTKQSK